MQRKRILKLLAGMALAFALPSCPNQSSNRPHHGRERQCGSGYEHHVSNTQTGVRWAATCNEAGYYTFAQVPPGTYEMLFKKAGFRPISRTGITLQVNQVARIDVTLQVGEVTQRLEVVDTAPLVDRETGAMGTVISNQNIVNLPLNARNPYALTHLVAGVIQLVQYPAIWLPGNRIRCRKLRRCLSGSKHPTPSPTRLEANLLG
jgi:hypothetical protein